MCQVRKASQPVDAAGAISPAGRGQGARRTGTAARLPQFGKGNGASGESTPGRAVERRGEDAANGFFAAPCPRRTPAIQEGVEHKPTITIPRATAPGRRS